MPVSPGRRAVRTLLRSRSSAVALFVVVGTLSIAATAASGSQPSDQTPIPDVVFRPVSVPPPSNPVPEAASLDAPDASDPLGELRDLAFATPPPPRAQPSLDSANPVVIAVPTPTPKPPRTSHSIRGYASYYCRAGSSPCTYGYSDVAGFQAYAAAGPALRAAIGSGWRGSIVYVDGIRVKLIDWCQCYKGESNEKLLDLYYDVFARTGSPVTVRW